MARLSGLGRPSNQGEKQVVNPLVGVWADMWVECGMNHKRVRLYGLFIPDANPIGDATSFKALSHGANVGL